MIGLGSVGEACAHELVVSGVARELVLLNRTVETAAAAALDLRQAAAWRGRLDTEAGSLGDCHLLEGCQLVIITAGARLRGDAPRSAMGIASARLLNDNVVPSLTAARQDGFLSDTIFLIVTNPVEPIVAWFRRKLALPRERVIGLGTTVDSARCSLHLANSFEVDANSAWVHLVGEHGPKMFPPNPGRLAGLVEPERLERGVARSVDRSRGDARLIRSLAEAVAKKKTSSLRSQFEGMLRDGGAAAVAPGILDGFFDLVSAAVAPAATRYAIAAGAAAVATAVKNNSRRIFTVSAQPPARLAVGDAALALPFEITRTGVGGCILEAVPAGLSDLGREIEQQVAEIEQALAT